MSHNQTISVTGARFGYKKAGQDISVLQDVNVNFSEGDFVGIVGLNGIGKSTFLKSLCGLLPLLSGKVTIDGICINDFTLQALAKKIGIVLTEKINGFNLTAYDVVAAGQMPYTDAFNRLGKENKLVIDAAIAMCGLGNHQHKLVNELSDGLFQKTVIAKALAQQTPVLLLDEPSAFLDYASKHELFLLLKNLAEQHKKSVLVSSHDLDLLLKYCNKLFIISGETTSLITVEEAAQNQAFRELGGGFI